MHPTPEYYVVTTAGNLHAYLLESQAPLWVSSLVDKGSSGSIVLPLSNYVVVLASTVIYVVDKLTGARVSTTVYPVNS